MLGYIIYGDGPKRPELGERRLLGVPFLTLSMGQPAPSPWASGPSPGPAGRPADAGAGGPQRGVSGGLSLYRPSSWARGSALWTPFPCGGALAAPLTRRKLESMGLGPTQAVVAVSAQRLIREAEDAVRSLALSFRYVLLSAGSGGEVLARSCGGEYGISLLLDPPRDQLDRADALLLYAPRPDLAGDNAVLWGPLPRRGAGPGPPALVLPAALAEQVEPQLRPGAADSGPVRPGRPASGGRSHGNS